MGPIIYISTNPNCLFLNNIQRMNTTLVRIAPCFTTVTQIRQNESTIYSRLYKALLVSKCLTLYITETFFAILFFMTLMCLLQFNWKSKCTPRNFVTKTLVISIPFILIVWLE